MRSRYASGRPSASATALRLTGASPPCSPSWMSRRTPYSALVVKIIASNPTNAVGLLTPCRPSIGYKTRAVMERPLPALDAVLEALPDAVIVVDAARVVVGAIERALAMFGHEAATLLGRHVDLLLPEEHRTDARAGR